MSFWSKGTETADPPPPPHQMDKREEKDWNLDQAKFENSQGIEKISRSERIPHAGSYW